MDVQMGYTAGQVLPRSHFQDRRPREVEPKDVQPQPELRPQSELRPQFRLRPGQDDMLIEWLASMAPRRRSAAIRDALYQHLAVRQRAGDSGDWTEDPDLAAALDALF